MILNSFLQLAGVEDESWSVSSFVYMVLQLLRDQDVTVCDNIDKIVGLLEECIDDLNEPHDFTRKIMFGYVTKLY